VFLAGILAHELSHAIVARREGLEVDGIVLWLLGGYTRVRGDSPSPGAELRVSGVGPLVSLLIGIGFAVVAVGGHVVGVGRLWVATVEWLAVINVALAIFNLLPGAPLDGGRVLHAALWRRSGDRLRATRAVCRTGRALGAIMIGLGVAEILTGRSGGDALWLGLVGWFLMAAAGAEESQAQVADALTGLRVGDLMAPWPVVGPGWLTVQAFFDEYVSRSPQPAWPVEQWGGGLAGLVPVGALAAIPPAERWRIRAVDLAIPLAMLATARPDEPAVDLYERMGDRRAGWALVYDTAGRLIGVVPAGALMAAARRGGPDDPADRRPGPQPAGSAVH
jgi:Zn-dependent protease